MWGGIPLPRAAAPAGLGAKRASGLQQPTSEIEGLASFVWGEQKQREQDRSQHGLQGAGGDEGNGQWSVLANFSSSVLQPVSWHCSCSENLFVPLVCGARDGEGSLRCCLGKGHEDMRHLQLLPLTTCKSVHPRGREGRKAAEKATEEVLHHSEHDHHWELAEPPSCPSSHPAPSSSTAQAVPTASPSVARTRRMASTPEGRGSWGTQVWAGN